MPNETLISRIETLLDEVVSLGGASERTGIVSGLIVVDSAPSSAALANHIIVRDSRDGNFISVLKTPGQTYANNDLVSVLFIEGTEPIALAQSPGSSSGNVKVSEIWESDFGAVAGEADASGNFVWNNWQAADVNGFIVVNSSGVAANAGDVGYLDDNSEYQTTTISADRKTHPVAVVRGGANNADIYVTEGPGRLTINYAGSAPSSGDFLIFSTTAGSVAAQTTMSPEILARARANGSGGAVEVELLLRTLPLTIVFDDQLYRTDQATLTSTSDFVALIDSLPGGALVRYDTPTSGNENNLTPHNPNDLGNLVLHNTTRGNSALILDNDTTGGAGYDGEITLTANVPGDWQAGDTITIRSQTNTTTPGGARWVDIDISGASEIPELTRSLDVEMQGWDTGLSSLLTMKIHSFETNSGSKRRSIFLTLASTSPSTVVIAPVDVINRRVCALWQSSGANTAAFAMSIVRLSVAG